MNWVRQIFSRRRAYHDLSEEIQEHLEERTEELVAGGMARADAAAAARREFGNVALIQEDSRAVWQWPMSENLLIDVRYALRGLRRNPGFTAVAVLTLGLGIGANTAIFSVVKAVLWQPLPLRHPQRVVVLHDQLPSWDNPRTKLSVLQFVELSERADLFESSGALKADDLNLTGRDRAVRLPVMEATAGAFPTLGIEPILGRAFTASDQSGGGAHVALLSHELWCRLFNADRKAIGEKLVLDGDSYEIVGVLPETIEILYPHAELWIPAIFSPESLTEKYRWWVNYAMVARLRSGVSVGMAQAAMETVSAPFNGDGFKFGIEVRRWADEFDEEQVGDTRRALYILLAAVGLVLLIGCTNIANLLLARNAARSREIAIRSSMGAGRTRIVTQLLTESLLLALFGGVTGLLLAYASMGALIRLSPANLPHSATIGLDSGVLLFTFLVTSIAGILFGLVPAVLSSRTDLVQTLKEGDRGSTSRRSGRQLRGVLVACEIALAMVLLVESGLLLRSFSKLLDVPPGFDPSSLLTMRTSLPKTVHEDSAQLPLFSKALLDRISAVPGVVQATLATGIPFSPDGYSSTFDIRNWQAVRNDSLPHAKVTYVAPSYFQTLRIPLIQGRLFSAADVRSGSGAAKGAVRIIDDALAKRFWLHGEAIGAEINTGNDDHWATIIGVVGSVHDRNLATAETVGTIYFPGYVGTTLAIRTASDPMALAGVVTEQVRAIAGDVPVYDVGTMSDLVGTTLARRRFALTLFLLFALLAFVLALMGLYGVIAYLVAERAGEIGVRMALGAQQTDVLKLMLSEGFGMAFLGVGLGLLVTVLVRPLMASQLYGVGPTDSFTLFAVSLSLLGAAMTATFIPALRVTRVDPMVALRHD